MVAHSLHVALCAFKKEVAHSLHVALCAIENDMKTSMDRILAGLVAVLAVALVWVVYGTLEPAVVNAGDKAPGFNITTDRGRKLTPSDFGGKMLVLNFWATWCAPCVEEVPSLNAFQKRFANAGVKVVAVSIDKNPQKYRAFLDRIHVSFETARDPNADVSAEYGTFQYPETYIIK